MSPTGPRAKQRWSRRADLVHRAEHGKREPIVVGCWVVVADQDCERPLAMALVSEGPDYVHQDGHALDEVWTLHTGEQRNRADLTPLDLAGILEDGARLLAASRSGGLHAGDDDVSILRVHRAACLAREAIATVDDQATRDVLEAVVSIDEAICEAEVAWRDFVRTCLPNLARSLGTAGMLELARSPMWEPNTDSIAHPRWIITATDNTKGPTT